MTLRTLSLLVCAIASPGWAAGLQVEVFTASPDGLLVTSTLVSTEKEALLVDAQFTLSEAHRLAAKILESKKVLKTIFITHAHPDHFFGLEVLKAQFPEAEIVTTPAVLEEMKAITPGKITLWKPMFGANLTGAPVYPAAFAGDHFELEGQRLELVNLPAGESAASTVVWLPSVKTAIVGDLAYNGVHVWLTDTDATRRETWLKSLQQIKALGAQTVISGHQTADAKQTPAVLDATAAYIRDFHAAVASAKSADDVVSKLGAKYRALQLPVILSIGAKAAVPAAH